MNSSEPRYEIHGQSIFFKKVPLVLHISFSRKYYGLSISAARRKMKGWHTRGQQDEIIHYLKTQKYITQ
jgi:hypothetical protein